MYNIIILVFLAFVKLFFQILDLFLFQEVLSQAMLRVYHVTSFFARGKIKFFLKDVGLQYMCYTLKT